MNEQINQEQVSKMNSEELIMVPKEILLKVRTLVEDDVFVRQMHCELREVLLIKYEDDIAVEMIPEAYRFPHCTFSQVATTMIQSMLLHNQLDKLLGDEPLYTQTILDMAEEWTLR